MSELAEKLGGDMATSPQKRAYAKGVAWGIAAERERAP